MPSKNPRQARLFAMAAHDPAAAKRLHIPQSVAKKFVRADKKSGMLKRAMKQLHKKH